MYILCGAVGEVVIFSSCAAYCEFESDIGLIIIYYFIIIRPICYQEYRLYFYAGFWHAKLKCGLCKLWRDRGNGRITQLLPNFEISELAKL